MSFKINQADGTEKYLIMYREISTIYPKTVSVASLRFPRIYNLPLATVV